MMYPNASHGYMPFSPTYEQRKVKYQRTRHKSAEGKKGTLQDPRKTNSLPALSRELVKANPKFMSVPDLEKSKESLGSKESVLAAFLSLFKKTKKSKSKNDDNSSPSRQRSDSEKENMRTGHRRLESIMEEDEKSVEMLHSKRPKTDDGIDSTGSLPTMTCSSHLGKSNGSL